jgi:hypothetical protein
MLDAQLHYPVFEFAPRGRTTTHPVSVVKRGVRRVFRIGESRPASRDKRTR